MGGKKAENMQRGVAAANAELKVNGAVDARRMAGGSRMFLRH